ncbi:hypothetical protein INR49_018839 [Caranx melampygus]|nr:hypothetical protein INR49_018839 [Caranx melampygus]
MAHLTQNPADKERFICFYPAVENPSCSEIRDVLTAAGMNVYMENKMHPREWNRDVQFRGRKDVMLYVAEMIPKLKTRTQKSSGGDTSSQQGEGGKKSKKKKK